jgi:hypothetical protein
MTPAEIKLIQPNGIDWLGNPLKVDGITGPKTKWWQGILSLDLKRQNVLRLALGYHASNIVFEKTGRNDSEFVDKLFEPVGMQRKGYPWCCALVSHIMRECDVEWPKYHVSAWTIIDWAKRNNLIVEDPLPSDIEAYLYPKIKGEDRKGHVRIVSAWDKPNKISCGVDGNINNDIRVGRRHERPDRYFIRASNLTGSHGDLFFPVNTVNLDQLADR